MGSVTRNQALAMEVIERVCGSGVRTFCLCPGGRNAPIVEALETLRGEGVEVLDFFDERGAAFFALGRARRDSRPVAVVTTSGTAAAELLPAMVEAYYSGAQLFAITADRPRVYRGTGAPQSIKQPGLFGVHVRQLFDLDEAGGSWMIDCCCWPVHLNVCFDEPLLSGWDAALRPCLPSDDDGPKSCPGALRPSLPDERVAATVTGLRRPLVILGALHTPADRDDVAAFCERVGAPTIAEASSHLRSRLERRLLRGGELTAAEGLRRQWFDGVLRVGDIPSFRLWRDLDRNRSLPVVSVSRQPWRGLTHGVHVEVGPDSRLPLDRLHPGADFQAETLRRLDAEDDRVCAARERLLRNFPLSEPAMVRELSCVIPEGSFVYLGNSLPIREWNEFAALERRVFEQGESRGANGIDGQLSTFLGSVRPDRENWAIVGDLTALYDLPALWALPQANVPVRIVIINNGGGRIFRRMFENPRFQNAHSIRFDLWARMWGAAYSTDASLVPGTGAVVVEMQPDIAQTDAFWHASRVASGR